MKKLFTFILILLCTFMLSAASDDFEKFTIIDNEECSIIITGLQEDSDYTVKTQLVNKSDTVTYMFAVDTATINGVVCDPFFAASVAPGKRANKRITFDLDDLHSLGLKEITDIAIKMRVHNDDDWMADSVVDEWVHIYPQGKNKALKFIRQTKSTDTVVVDEKNVKFTVLGYDYTGSFEPFNIIIYLENNTDKNLMFGIEEASLDGLMIDPFYATSVPAHSSKLSDIGWMSSTLEENDITPEEITSVEFELHIYDEDDWFASPIFKDFVEINP